MFKSEKKLYKKNQKIRMIYIWALVLTLFVVSLVWAYHKLTYIERKMFNDSDDTFIILENNNDVIEQEFIMPYDYLRGVSVCINTLGRDNNSKWNLTVRDEQNRIIWDKIFEASLLQDNSYNIINIDKNIRVDKNNKYTLEFRAIDVDLFSGLGFYTSDKSVIDDATLQFNSEPIDADLCFEIMGGDLDFWWIGFIIILFVLLGFTVFKIEKLYRENKKITEDTFTQGLIVLGIVFLMLCTFAVTSGYCDETDNMLGGMIIANGGILYRDYVTQHTPLAYYICSLFALTGAASIEQFRLSYYLLQSIIWSLVYIRYSKTIGSKKMFILPILEIICQTAIIFPYNIRIYAEGIQGILFVILILEFLCYLKDKQLGLGRCCIISVCFWGSIGSVFMSVYALIWIILAVAIIEIIDWKHREISVRNILVRYYKLAITMIVPLCCAFIYFKLNNSLESAINQFYRFNREVYPKYVAGLGENVLQPIVNSIQHFFGIFIDNFNTIISASATNVNILQLLLMVSVIGFTILLYMKGEKWESIIPFLIMIFSAPRGYGFHGLAAWYTAILIVDLNFDVILERIATMSKILLAIVLIMLLYVYTTEVGNNLLHQEVCISELESEVIELTEDSKDIYLDAWTSGSLYYLYKDKYPVNSAVFMLPWYMDWYEEDNIVALDNSQPQIVIYNEDEEVWGHTNYSSEFAYSLKEKYSRLSNDSTSWKYNIWTRNS